MQKELFKRMELLEEIRRFQSNQFAEIEVAKSAVRNIMGTASVIVSVVAAFLTATQSCNPTCVGNMKIVSVLFGLLVIISVWSLSPATLRTPIEISQKNIDIYYKSKRYKTEIAFIERIINRYLAAVEENLAIVGSRKKLAAAAGLVFGLMIFLLFISLGG
jgi:hypothetical protein